MSPAVSEELSSYNYYGRAVKTARPYSLSQRFRKLGASRVQHLCRRIISIKGSLQLMYQFLLARLPDQLRFLMPSVCNISIQGVNGTGCLVEVKDRKVAGIHSQRAVITDPITISTFQSGQTAIASSPGPCATFGGLFFRSGRCNCG